MNESSQPLLGSIGAVGTVGYVWVDALEHNEQFQRELLRQQGVAVIYSDVSGRAATQMRPQLTEALDAIGAGDVLVVWRLDRLGSSMSGVLALLELLGRRHVGVRSLAERLDTTADGGALLGVIAAFTELDRCLTRQKTLNGVYAARARGRVGGRPRARSGTNVDRVLMMREQGSSVREIAEQLGTSRATVYRVLESATADGPTSSSLTLSLPVFNERGEGDLHPATD